MSRHLSSPPAVPAATWCPRMRWRPSWRAGPSRRIGQRRSRREDPRAVRRRIETHVLPAGRWAAAPLGYGPRGGRSWRDGDGDAAVQERSSDCGDRFWRLSGACRAARRAPCRYPDRDPRTECRAGPRQPPAGRARRRDRDRLSTKSKRLPPAMPPRRIWSAIRCATVMALRERAFPGAARGRHLPPARDRRQPGRDGALRWCPTAGAAAAHFRRRLQVTQQCRVEDIDRARQIYADLGIPADVSPPISPICPSGWLGASRDRARRRIDRRRADRGRTSGDPRAAAQRDRRSPDRQCRASRRRRRRTLDPAASLHRDRTRQADPEAGARTRALENAGARA
jgi:hypothetical protein